MKLIRSYQKGRFSWELAGIIFLWRHFTCLLKTSGPKSISPQPQKFDKPSYKVKFLRGVSFLRSLKISLFSYWCSWRGLIACWGSPFPVYSPNLMFFQYIKNFSSFTYIFSQCCNIFVICNTVFFRTEQTDFSFRLSHSGAAFTSHHGFILPL